jgi:SNF2 family DNA or RNA helicase
MIEVGEGEDPFGFTTQTVELVSPSNKADDLLDFIGDNPGQLVVAANSPRLISLCETKLGAHKINSVKLVGGQSAAERHGYIEAFRDGKVQVLFLTAGVGGEGIDGLQVADTVFFLQPNPSLLQREQIIGRLDRIGQHSPVRVVHSHTPGTVEKGLYELGNQKEERASAVTRDADLLRWILQYEGDDDLAGSLK